MYTLYSFLPTPPSTVDCRYSVWDYCPWRRFIAIVNCNTHWSNPFPCLHVPLICKSHILCKYRLYPMCTFSSWLPANWDPKDLQVSNIPALRLTDVWPLYTPCGIGRFIHDSSKPTGIHWIQCIHYKHFDFKAISSSLKICTATDPHFSNYCVVSANKTAWWASFPLMQPLNILKRHPVLSFRANGQ